MECLAVSVPVGVLVSSENPKALHACAGRMLEHGNGGGDRFAVQTVALRAAGFRPGKEMVSLR